MKKTYEFENLGCAHCAGKMEEKIGKLPDVESVNLSFPMKKMYLETSPNMILQTLLILLTRYHIHLTYNHFLPNTFL